MARPFLNIWKFLEIVPRVFFGGVFQDGISAIIVVSMAV